MTFTRPIASSFLIHMAALAVLWVVFVPRIPHQIPFPYRMDMELETPGAAIGTASRPTRALLRKRFERAGSVASGPRAFSAAREIRNQVRGVEAPSSGRIASEYQSYFAQIRDQVFQALSGPWKEQRAQLSRRGVNGRVILKVVLSPKGEVLGSEIAQSSGFAQLDLLASDAVRGAGPFPEPSGGLKGLGNLSLTLPIEFGSRLQ